MQAGDQLLNPLVDFLVRRRLVSGAGDQLLNPLVDFKRGKHHPVVRWGSTLKPPGRLHR